MGQHREGPVKQLSQTVCVQTQSILGQGTAVSKSETCHKALTDSNDPGLSLAAWALLQVPLDDTQHNAASRDGSRTQQSFK